MVPAEAFADELARPLARPVVAVRAIDTVGVAPESPIVAETDRGLGHEPGTEACGHEVVLHVEELDRVGLVAGLRRRPYRRGADERLKRLPRPAGGDPVGRVALFGQAGQLDDPHGARDAGETTGDRLGVVAAGVVAIG